MRMLALFAVLVPLVMPTSGFAEEKPAATLYKTPDCGCCEGYADHLRANGFAVAVIPSHDHRHRAARHAGRLAGHARPEARALHGL
jgi:hypothetical protein